jgi:CRISPR-associated protein Csx10
MPRKILSIQSVDGLILSQSSNTAGEHHSLDHIPGSTILGALAGRIYSKLEDKSAQWAVFHSGKLRFGNCYPTTARCVESRPLPLSFHEVKNISAIIDGKLNNENVTDFRDGEPNDNRQYKQLRAGYLTADGKITNAQSALQVKTAIDYETGTAKESQLYGYDALASNQWFCGDISWDDDFVVQYPKAFDALMALLDDGTFRVGRSKGAEFGRVKAYLDDAEPEISTLDSNTFSIFCLSDISVRDAFGQPVLALTAHHFGLTDDDIKLIPSRCFVRTREYSVYNGARRAHDQARHVIGKGSVFTFLVSGDAATVTEKLQNALMRGIGAHTEAGLGRISLRVIPEPVNGKDVGIVSNISQPVSSALITWLQARASSSIDTAKADDNAKALLDEIQKQYLQGRQLNAIDDSAAWGPNVSHWSAVNTQCKQADSDETLMQALFSNKQPVIEWREAGSAASEARKNNPWLVEVVDEEGRFHSFGNWLRTYLMRLRDTGVDIRATLLRASRKQRSALQQQGGM